jgi:hypothetical protein
MPLASLRPTLLFPVCYFIICRGYQQHSLNDNWVYLFAENQRENYSAPDFDDSAWIPLPQLSDWSVASSVNSGADWFRRAIELTSTEVCVNYELTIGHLPETACVYLNGQLVGNAERNKPFGCDVTSYVALGRNVLAIQLIYTSEAGGGAGDICLRPSL